MPRRTEVTAIMDQQLVPVLRNLGVEADYLSGRLCCTFCDQPLREVGIATVRMADGRLIFVCRQIRCMDHMYE